MYKFIVKDFDGAGQYLVRTNLDFVKDTGFLTTITYKVGYDYRGKRGSHSIYLISMSDGLIFDGHKDKKTKTRIFWEAGGTTLSEKVNPERAKKVFVDFLNDKTTENYRFATQEEIVRVVMHQNWRWRNK